MGMPVSLDEQSFSQLFDEYWASLCRFAAIATRDDDDAREIVAKVFAVLWERREAWNVATTVQAYLYGAVRNEIWHRHRDTKRRAELLEQHLDDEGLAEVDIASITALEWRLTLQQLVAGLPERYQMAIHLRYRRDLEYAEIGEILDITPETAKKLVNRAVSSLRKINSQE